MALRKQKDPARVEAANKAWETMRGRYPERYGKNKQNGGADDKAHDTPKETHCDEAEAEAKWRVTSQSTLTLKVDLPMRERLTDFVDTPWTEKHRPVSLNDCIGNVVGYRARECTGVRGSISSENSPFQLALISAGM